MTICPSSRKLQIIEGILNMTLVAIWKIVPCLSSQTLNLWIASGQIVQPESVSDGWGLLQVWGHYCSKVINYTDISVIDEVHLAQVRCSLGMDLDLTTSRISKAWYTKLDIPEILKFQEVLQWLSFILISSVPCRFVLSIEEF